jgi:hypothetical protein
VHYSQVKVDGRKVGRSGPWTTSPWGSGPLGPSGPVRPMDFPTLRPQAHIQHSALILVSSQQKHLTAHSLHFSPRNSSPAPCHDWPVKNHSVSHPSRVCLARLPTNGWCNIGRTSTHRATQAYPLDRVRHCNSYIRSTGIHWSPGMR